MTEKQIEFGFWYWDTAINFPPDSITYPHEYKGQSKLNIACTQILDMTPTQQKKLVKEWTDFLPNCKKIEMLWFTTQLTQQLFDSACKLKNLTGLNIKWSKIIKLDNISNLTSLKYLRIGSSAKVESIKPLSTLTNLEVLDIQNFKKITDFSPLSNLTNLRFLSIEGGMYTKQKVDTFEPISKLTNLIYFSTAMISCVDKRIDPVLNLKNLLTLNWAFDIPKKDMERLKTELLKLKYLPHRYYEENMKKLKASFG
jgi:Leucine-rich repeat (LRR) protein